MGEKKLKSDSKKTVRIAVIFFLFLLGVALFSLICKGVLLLQQSKFDSKHVFTISVSNEKDTEIISFFPNSKQMSILKLKDSHGKNMNKVLAIHTDGEINSEIFDFEDKNVSSLMFKSLANLGKLETNIGIVDLIKLSFFSQKISLNEVETEEVSLNLNPSEIDKLVFPLVGDKDIAKDNQTIEIINGTEVAGLGSWLSRLLTNMGANVILVTNSDNPQEESSIYFNGEKTYTTERLNKVLNFPLTEKEDRGLADIVVLVGKNSLSSLPF